MKRSIPVIMMVLVVSCIRQQEIDHVDKICVGQELTITADAPGYEQLSKTTRDAEGKVYWSAGEEISLFYGSGDNGGSCFTSTNSEPVKTAQFSGVINVITGVVEDSDEVYFWGLYPYNSENSCDGSSATMVIPSSQISQEGSFSDGMFPSIGRSLGLVMGFYNVCGGFKFRLSQENITSITFRGNDNEVIAGKVEVAFGLDGKPAVTDIVSGEKEIVITPAAGGAFQTGVDYFIVIRPVTFSQGVTFVFEKANGSKGTRSVNASFPINRSQFQHSSSAIDTGVEFAFIPEMVDLGLSVKWASFNLGASQPEEYGDYYAWGEIAPQDYSEFSFSYDWMTYRWGYWDNQMMLTKYCPLDQASYWYGSETPDGKIELDSEDDPSRKLGNCWRMPTAVEWMELRYGCWWEETTVNGINGYRIRGQKEGYQDKSIFLPAAGYRDNSGLNNYGCCYWSSSLNPTAPLTAYALSESSWASYGIERYKGYSIRPVYGEPPVRVTGVSLSETSMTLAIDEYYDLTATVSPSNASIKMVKWSSSDSSIAVVDSDGRIWARTPGTATITVTTIDGDYTATCIVRVPDIPIPEPIDLGLSVKWGSFNIGASSSEGYGDYFAWGETESKSTFRFHNYKWDNGQSCYTKYNDTDHLTALEEEDDVAQVKLGGGWRMPSINEWLELMNDSNCTLVWTSQNGINGYRVTSKKEGFTNNSIFLPATGSWDDEPTGIGELYNVGSSGEYWSSNKSSSLWECAKSVSFWTNRIDTWDEYRCYGLSIRPVYVE